MARGDGAPSLVLGVHTQLLTKFSAVAFPEENPYAADHLPTVDPTELGG